jgi:hypothetical protein
MTQRITTDRDFEFETEIGELKGTAHLDVTDDLVKVISIEFEDEKLLLKSLKDFVEETIINDHEFRAQDIRLELQEWEESEKYDGQRKDRDFLGDDEC